MNDGLLYADSELAVIVNMDSVATTDVLSKLVAIRTETVHDDGWRFSPNPDSTCW